ncbi:MAG: AzlC family ABC transporter permease [Ruminococcaceae bacterium]|nr:AzlC family ABC transporter permease [Oscillospiraceae bacterium]
MKSFLKGLRLGVPIGLGYLSVSFTFGISAVYNGLYWWQAVIISMTTLTSAGQLAGIGTIAAGGSYLEMLVSQLTINLRYSFMSVSLSQKTTAEFSGVKRWLMGFFMTDEIFATASSQKEVSTKLFAGISVMPYIGWTLGTLFGSLLGNVLPDSLMNALCIAIYGMFVAIVAPVAKDNRSVLCVVGLAIGLSAAFYYLPLFKGLSTGLAISICAVAAALFGAFLFPVKEDGADGR